MGIGYLITDMDGLKPLTTTLGIAARDAHLLALSHLAGRMVHDFNNYLTPIKGYLGLFKEECLPESAARRYAGLMEKAAGKIEFNVEAIAAAVRPERSFRPSTENFHDIIGGTIADWTARTAAPAPVPIKTFLSPCVLSLDACQWRSVIVHLLENARLACATGGTIVVKLAPASLPSN